MQIGPVFMGTSPIKSQVSTGCRPGTRWISIWDLEAWTTTSCCRIGLEFEKSGSCGRATLTALDLRSLARGSSLVLLVLCFVAARAQTFGRFGYTPCQALPGWTLSRSGFKADSSAADSFSFAQPAADWSPTQTSSTSQIVSLGNASPGAPSQIKMDLLSPGFSLYFGDGIDLKLSSTGAPFQVTLR